MEHRGGLRRVVIQPLEDRRAFPRGAPQHGVDEPRRVRARLLGQLDVLVHRGVLGRAAQIQQLVQPETEHREHGRVEALEPAVGQLRGDVIERGAPLDGPVGERHRQRAVARLEPGRLGGERSVGVGVVLEHAADDPERARPRRRHAALAPGRHAR